MGRGRFKHEPERVQGLHRLWAQPVHALRFPWGSLDTTKRSITLFMEVAMTFIWDDNNLSHLASHGVTRELAETIFRTGIADAEVSTMNNRYILEAEVDGRAYRLIFDLSHEGSVYPITAFPL